MYLAVSSVTLSATWLIWIWAYSAHRRPEPPAWTRHNAASIAVLLVVVSLLPVGIGYLAVSLISPLEALRDLDVAEAALALGLPLLTVLATPRLLAPMRQNPAVDPIALRKEGAVGLKAKV
jgi:hypothetical protein